MAEDFYNDQETPESITENTSENDPVTMLSKSIFPGKECKPGDILKVEVVSVQGDQVAVKASKGGYDETEEPEEIEEEETEDEGESEMMGESMSPMAGAMPPQSGEGMYS